MSGLIGHRGLLLLEAADPHISIVVFDPTKTDPGVTLSDGDLRASANINGSGHAKSLVTHASGKWYLEIEVETFSTNGSGAVGMIGLVTPSTPLATIIGGGTGGSAYWAVKISGGRRQVYFEGVVVATGFGSTANGSIARMAWDADAGTVWFGLNDIWLGDPSAGTGGAYTAASLQGEHHFGVCPRNTANHLKVKTAPVHSVPTGFTYW